MIVKLILVGAGYLAGVWSGILLLALMAAAGKNDDWRDQEDDRH